MNKNKNLDHVLEPQFHVSGEYSINPPSYTHMQMVQQILALDFGTEDHESEVKNYIILSKPLAILGD